MRFYWWRGVQARDHSCEVSSIDTDALPVESHWRFVPPPAVFGACECVSPQIGEGTNKSKPRVKRQ